MNVQVNSWTDETISEQNIHPTRLVIVILCFKNYTDIFFLSYVHYQNFLGLKASLVVDFEVNHLLMGVN